MGWGFTLLVTGLCSNGKEQDTTLEGSKEAAGEVTISEGHPHITSPGWSMLGR